MAHQEIGFRLLERVRGDLDPYAVVEQFPKMEGRQLVMMLSPKKVAKTPPRPATKATSSAPGANAASGSDAAKVEAATGVTKK
jgi:translation initiation factor IF-3